MSTRVDETFRRTVIGEGAKSSQGFVVKLDGQCWISYKSRSGERFAVGAEFSVGEKSLYLYKDQIQPIAAVSDRARDIILSDVSNALRFLGWEYAIV